MQVSEILLRGKAAMLLGVHTLGIDGARTQREKEESR
jgi:hypothetical protein